MSEYNILIGNVGIDQWIPTTRSSETSQGPIFAPKSKIETSKEEKQETFDKIERADKESFKPFSDIVYGLPVNTGACATNNSAINDYVTTLYNKTIQLYDACIVSEFCTRFLNKMQNVHSYYALTYVGGQGGEYTKSFALISNNKDIMINPMYNNINSNKTIETNNILARDYFKKTPADGHTLIENDNEHKAYFTDGNKYIGLYGDMQVGYITIAGIKIAVINVHYHPNMNGKPEDLIKAIKFIVTKVKSQSINNIIVAGDFNYAYTIMQLRKDSLFSKFKCGADVSANLVCDDEAYRECVNAECKIETSKKCIHPSCINRHIYDKLSDPKICNKRQKHKMLIDVIYDLDNFKLSLIDDKKITCDLNLSTSSHMLLPVTLTLHKPLPEKKIAPMRAPTKQRIPIIQRNMPTDQPSYTEYPAYPPMLYQPMPYQPMPDQPMPYPSIPYQPIPYQPIPYPSIPYPPIPYQPIPYQPIPYQPIPYSSMPDQPIPDQPMPYSSMPFPPYPSGPYPQYPQMSPYGYPYQMGGEHYEEKYKKYKGKYLELKKIRNML